MDSFDKHALEDGDIFVRTGRALLLSDISPNKPPCGYNYVYKTIVISMKTDDETHGSRELDTTLALIHPPPDYHCDVKYIHPWYKAEKDPYTVEHRSLRIQMQHFERPDDNKDVSQTLAYRCSLLNDMSTNIIKGRNPLDQVRLRPDSILICLQLTKENSTPRQIEPTSFLVLLASLPFRLTTGTWLWYGLAPLSEQSSQISPIYPSQISRNLVGHRSLRIAHETFTVRKFAMSNGLLSLDGFMVDVKSIEIPRSTKSTKILKLMKGIKISPEQLWMFFNLVVWFIYRTVLSLGPYLVIVYLMTDLLKPNNDGPYPRFALYLCIFLIPPIIYQVKKERGEAYQFFSRVEILDSVLIIGFIVSLSFPFAINILVTGVRVIMTAFGLMGHQVTQ